MMKSETDDINKLASAALWYQQLAHTNNVRFMGLFQNEKRYLVLVGGAGSGKSIFAGRKVLERITGEKGHRILVCRKVARTLRESCFAQLRGQIGEHYCSSDFKINLSDMLITYKNGSKIIFAGLDDAEKLKSIYNITGIWIEEASETMETDLNQLDMRLRGITPYYQQIIITFNPTDVNHWLKHRFFDAALPDVTTHMSTYKDNRFLDEKQKEVLESYKDIDTYFYQVYCLGQWGVYGKTIFNAHKISERLHTLSAPLKRGSFSYEYDGLNLLNITFAEDENECIAVYKEPVQGVPYVIGGDTAGEGTDNFAAQVLDNITGEQVAVLRHPFDEDVYARELYCLGKYYNNALIGIESNFSSYPIKELERLGYDKQYIRQSEDTFTHKIQNAYGFKTTSATRPVIIGNLVQIIRDGIELINDKDTLEEMLTFVRNEKGRAEAQQGSHDDLIMALAIAYYIREQQSVKIEAQPWQPKFNFEFERPKAGSFDKGEDIIII